ncbi:MAG: acylhydrolase [Chitinophagaceae bacterium]|nr:MAG: acylhydrolase [Chitinophagaceae bacterium]
MVNKEEQRTNEKAKAQRRAEDFAHLQKYYDSLFHNDWAWISKYQEANARLSPPAPGEKRVVFLGNSITENWYNMDPAFFKKNHYIGRGIGGQVSSQMLVRFREDVINLKPAIVVIEAGTNDIAENQGPVSLKNVFGNIVSMVELARANDFIPIISSVLPATDFPWHHGLKPAQKIIQLNTMLKAYAKSRHIIYVDYWSAMVNDEDGLKVDLSLDGFVHPNLAGYKIMEPIVQAAINKALKK